MRKRQHMIVVFGSRLKSYFYTESSLLWHTCMPTQACTQTHRGRQDGLFSALSTLWLAEADNRSCLFTLTGSTGI